MDLKAKALKLVSRKMGIIATAMTILTTIPTPDPTTNAIRVAGLVILPVVYVISQTIQNNRAVQNANKAEKE